MFDQAVRGSTAPITLKLRVLCAPLPPHSFGSYQEISLGLQQGMDLLLGTPEWVEGIEGRAFECEVRVRPHRAFGEPEFFGPCVHGSGGVRFLYLEWEGWNGAGWVRFRRMKLSLAGISWQQIRDAAMQGLPLEATVSGVGEDGTPASGSVRLREGWRLPVAGVVPSSRNVPLLYPLG